MLTHLCPPACGPSVTSAVLATVPRTVRAAWLVPDLVFSADTAPHDAVDGLWPYTYTECDVGTLPNQTCVRAVRATRASAKLTCPFVQLAERHRPLLGEARRRPRLRRGALIRMPFALAPHLPDRSTDAFAHSQLVGQRLSACTCPSDASEHPGPSVKVGRGAPESALP